MNPAKFEEFKFNQCAKRLGATVTFQRPKTNEYKEPTDVLSDIASLTVVFHKATSYVTKNTTDASVKTSVPLPMMLCLKKDTSVDSDHTLKQDDIVVFSGNTYKINGFNDVGQFGVLSDISLEVVDNGNNVGL